jgi:hypothetical protein
MQVTRMLALVPFLAATWAGPIVAQGIAVSGRVGTLGLGVDGSLGLTPQFGVRAGINVQPWQPEAEFEDIDFELDLPSPSFVGFVDWYPAGGGFRLTGGAVLFTNDTEVRGRPAEPVEIGDQSYTPEQIGTLSGEFVTEDLAPYLGIGFGRLGGRRGVGFTLDLGLAFQGKPDVQLSAAGPLASQPEFQSNLREEEEAIEGDAEWFRFYPVASIGVVIGI